MTPEPAQQSIFDAPAVARYRHDHPETSREAAESLAPAKLGRLEAVVLEIVNAFGPISDDEIRRRALASGYDAAECTLRVRRIELRDKGLIRASGEYGTTASGRRCILWEATG